MKSIISKIMAVIISVLTAIMPASSYGHTETPDEKAGTYPYVFVHGFAGWGYDDGLSELVPYWGMTYGQLTDYLNELGYECYNSSCGPFSSAWDRACELYAQLVGGTVDYGEAHSAKHGHDRYGRTYDEPLFNGWSSEKKINIVAHSFGGVTARLLIQLLKDGDTAECEASGEKVSPLFEGGKSDTVYSLTTLASPHNGTTTAYILDMSSGAPMEHILGGASLVLGNTALKYIFDVQLEQWGISDIPGEHPELLNIKKYRSFENGTDSAGYDLTLHGAAEINEELDIVDGIYYFSYAACCTEKDEKTGNQVSTVSGVSALMANPIGSFKGTHHNIEIDDKWLANDGMVNTFSALAPFDEPQKAFDKNNIESGVWQVMPIMNGWVHGSFQMGTPGSGTPEEIADFYINHFNYISDTYA